MHCIGKYVLIVKEGKISVSIVNSGCVCILVALAFAISIF
jgi:hypothetical protein